jgi:hypothetical protein
MGTRRFCEECDHTDLLKQGSPFSGLYLRLVRLNDSYAGRHTVVERRKYTQYETVIIYCVHTDYMPTFGS